MMELAPDQAKDLRDLQAACKSFSADLVIIGAVAYRIFVDDTYRTTEDIDIAVAFDLDVWPEFVSRLAARSWKQRPNREHRWRGPHGGLVDIIPAGPKLREQGRLVWPKSEMTMSLAGFDHVFADSVERELTPGLRIKVVPLPVLALLKILAFMDNPHARQKDIEDFFELLQRYEQDGDRRFSGAVFDAGVNFEQAGAFLLGMDVAPLCTPDEALAVGNFISQGGDEAHLAFAARRHYWPEAYDSSDVAVESLFGAFSLGFHGKVAS
jgi:predicted nucleotidyltransferase